jgi:hypothetical protein
MRSRLKLTSYAILAAGAMVIVGAVVVLLFQDPLLNRFVKPGITKAFAETNPAYSIRIGKMNYSFREDRFELDSVSVHAVDGTFSSTVGLVSVSRLAWAHVLWGGEHFPSRLCSVSCRSA